MLVVGITGGMGAGKTVVCTKFNKLGIPIYDADARAKKIINTDPKVKNALIKRFGKEAFLPNGKYNKKLIGELIFSNPKARKDLNKIIHPAVAKDTIQWTKKMAQAHHKYIIKESALLFESKANKSCDFTIFVYAPLSLRVKRVSKRNSISLSQALKKIKSQGNQSYKLKLVDFIIKNNEKTLLLPQIQLIHKQLLDNTRRLVLEKK